MTGCRIWTERQRGWNMNNYNINIKPLFFHVHVRAGDGGGTSTPSRRGSQLKQRPRLLAL